MSLSRCWFYINILRWNQIFKKWCCWIGNFWYLCQSVQSLSHVRLFATPWITGTPGLPAHHQLPESTQTHVHWVSDAIQLSHPLSSPSPPALNLSQHQGLFKWVLYLRFTQTSEEPTAWGEFRTCKTKHLPSTAPSTVLPHRPLCLCLACFLCWACPLSPVHLARYLRPAEMPPPPWSLPQLSSPRSLQGHSA